MMKVNLRGLGSNKKPGDERGERPGLKPEVKRGWDNRWDRIDKQALESYNTGINEAEIKEYYSGNICKFSFVLAGKTVERDIVRTIVDDVLSKRVLSHIILLEAGGEGKSTSLMQICVKLVENGKVVYYCENATKLMVNDVRFENDEIIIIDNANHVPNIDDVIYECSKKGVQIIMAARANEWEMLNITGEVNRTIKPYSLSGFSEREKREFSSLLKDYTSLDESEIYEIFNNKSNSFLLAAMLRIMNDGASLEKIVEDIIVNVNANNDYPYKDFAIQIFALICLIEQAGSKMPTFLFRNICLDIGDGVRINHQELVNKLLKKELQCTSVYVETRHPLISHLFFDNLKNIVIPEILFEELAKAERNLKVNVAKASITTRLSLTKEIDDLCSILGSVYEYVAETMPEYLTILDYAMQVNIDAFYQLNINACRELFKKWLSVNEAMAKEEEQIDAVISLYKYATEKWFYDVTEIWNRWAKYRKQLDKQGVSHGSESVRDIYREGIKHADENLLFAWMEYEISCDNIGDADTEDSALWICYQAMEMNKVNNSLLCRGTELEAARGNVGDISTLHSARGIYYWAIENDRAEENLLRQWARQEPLGEVGLKYSARWIYNWAIANDKAAENLLYQWAEIEVQNDNIGKDINDEYSARWIFHWGLKKGKAEETLLLKWAELEIANNNIGNDINDEYSARWILHWGMKNKKAEEILLQKWAALEASNDNIGPITQEYTARWIFNWALNHNKAGEFLLTKWAELEYQDNNIGNSVEDKYSARWIFHSGIISKKADENLLIKWAEMELATGNGYPGSIIEEYTPRWIYHWGFKSKKAKITLLSKWSELEIKQGNIGSVDEKFSARWIFNWAINHDRINEELLLRWVELEFQEQNYGSDEQKNTARYLLQTVYESGRVKSQYWRWMIAIDLEENNLQAAYEHCKSAVKETDIYGLFALVQGYRGIIEDEEEGMYSLLQKALSTKEGFFNHYCAYLCELLFGNRDPELLAKYKTLADYYLVNTRTYFQFWNRMAEETGL